ncbi:type II secretion system F family protein [Acidisoma cladoniae]|uniref:type II secretion system F family protein n=1 Tax=Acidisoma cladoniae TaxID=3040935 RepID=UPI00254E8D81|nr:type II secretion system F family protein [Acidisoma sp. PAMC 29798]
MPTFRYVAIDAAGRLQRGVSEAVNEAALVQALRRDGLSPVRAEPDRGESLIGRIDLTITRRGFRRQDVANFTRELAIMLAAGQDLDRALRFLTEMAPNTRLRGSLEALRNAVRDGSPLAAAMGKQPKSFSRLYVGLVRAGEAGGTLAATLERLALVLERERGLASSIRSAMIYPTLLFIAMVGSVSFLLTSVLPEFVPLFAQNGAKLPASTQFMIDSGHILSAYGLYLLVALGVAGLAAGQALKRPTLRMFVDRQMLRLPILGTLAKEILAARFCRTFGTLMLNGVPLIAALTIVRDVIGNTAAVAAMDVVSASAKGGAGLAAPLSASRLFPARMIYLLRLGEETAQLGQLCLRAAEIHEEETRLSLQRIVALLVPAITIVMGAAVAGIVSSLILAMLSLNSLAG